MAQSAVPADMLADTLQDGLQGLNNSVSGAALGSDVVHERGPVAAHAATVEARKADNVAAARTYTPSRPPGAGPLSADERRQIGLHRQIAERRAKADGRPEGDRVLEMQERDVARRAARDALEGTPGADDLATRTDARRNAERQLLTRQGRMVATGAPGADPLADLPAVRPSSELPAPARSKGSQRLAGANKALNGVEAVQNVHGLVTGPDGDSQLDAGMGLLGNLAEMTGSPVGQAAGLGVSLAQTGEGRRERLEGASGADVTADWTHRAVTATRDATGIDALGAAAGGAAFLGGTVLNGAWSAAHGVVGTVENLSAAAGAVTGEVVEGAKRFAADPVEGIKGAGRHAADAADSLDAWIPDATTSPTPMRNPPAPVPSSGVHPSPAEPTAARPGPLSPAEAAAISAHLRTLGLDGS